MSVTGLRTAMSSSSQRRNTTTQERIAVVLTGMDSSGRLYREQVSALHHGADTYCFFLSRHLRVNDSALIELPPDRPSDKPIKIPARVTFAEPGPDGKMEIHVRPQESAHHPGEAPTSVAHLLLAESAAPETPQNAPQVVTQPAASSASASPATPENSTPAGTAQAAAPLLDAVRTQATDVLLQEFRAKLAADSQALSIELGRKISKDLSEHAGKLGQALAGDLQTQMSQVQARLDEFHKYLDSVWAGCEAALEESQRARLQSFQEKTGALAGEAEDRLEKFRITLAEQQMAIEAHIQQTVWASLQQAVGRLEGQVEGLAGAAVARAQEQIRTHWSAQEQTLTQRAAGVQTRLQSLFDQLEGAVERAEAVLDPVRTVADLAEKRHAEQKSSPQQGQGAVALIPVDVSMRQQIQSSIAKARARFRESVGQISQLLESNLGHGNLAATMQEK